jgi:hypothetical protein
MKPGLALGMEDCRRCDGTGRCPRCAGSGEVTKN